MRESTPELLDKAKGLWDTGNPFFVTGVVSAPYSGCFHEPNIWLVVPEEDKMEWRTFTDGKTVVGLYATGQGAKVEDVVKSKEDFIKWLDDQTLEDINDSSIYGSFDSFEVHPIETKMNDLPPDSHYWTAAVRRAERDYDIALEWKCSDCGGDQVGRCESEQAPHHTGYRGNGGIGVFMYDALCDECFDSGVCRVCHDHGGEDYEIFDSDVKSSGSHLCSYHIQEMFKGLLVASQSVINDIEDYESIVLRVHDPAPPGQMMFPGMEEFKISRLSFFGDGEIIRVYAAFPLIVEQLKEHDLLEVVFTWKDGDYRAIPCEYGLQLIPSGLAKAIEEVEEEEELEVVHG